MLSVPIILEMSMEALFAICDAYFVSRLGNEEFLATIGLVESSMFVVISLALGISMAGTAVVSRRIGEKNYEAAADAGFQAIFLGVLFSLVIALVGVWYTPELLGLLGGSESLIREGQDYARIMISFNIILVLLFVINAIFRGAGDASIAMRTLILANGINIILDPCLIFGWWIFPELGFVGAAIATCIGRGIGVLYQLYILFNGKGLIRLTLKNIRIIPSVLRRILIITGGAAGQHLLTSFSWIFLITIVATFGSKVLAAYTISFRIIAFTILPAWGIAMAAATLVGQNLGAGQPDRAEKTAWQASFYNMIMLLTISIGVIIFARPIMTIFSQDDIIINEGIWALRIIFAGYVLYAYEMVLGQAFNGAGDSYTPTFLNFIAFWLIQIPLAYYLCHYTFLTSRGVYVSIAFSSCILALMAIYVFKKGRWKNIQV